MESNLSVQCIRWFYKPLKCKNTIPTIEPFSGYDSVRIENKYQEFIKGLDLDGCKLEVREGLRETCSRLKKKYFTKYKGRLEFLPVEWRTNLPLNEGIIRSVTITDCQPLRAYLNSTALDIMYYTSSIQRMEIMRAFHHEVARLYGLFCARNPHFIERGGKVSIIAHSLGAVVAFDVLTTSTPMRSDIAYIWMLQKMNNEFNENCDLISHQTRLTEIERKLLTRAESQKKVSELPSGAPFPEVRSLDLNCSMESVKRQKHSSYWRLRIKDYMSTCVFLPDSWRDTPGTDAKSSYV
ncbi:Phospholipase DDHD1 [Taenia solium]|eukprot:TsM_000686700 transcript=TsM_000686700 gene=TsM_000686700